MCFYIDYDTNKYQKRRKSGGELSKNPKSLPEKTIVERIKLMPQKRKTNKLLTILTVLLAQMLETIHKNKKTKSRKQCIYVINATKSSKYFAKILSSHYNNKSDHERQKACNNSITKN